MRQGLLGEQKQLMDKTVDSPQRIEGSFRDGHFQFLELTPYQVSASPGLTSWMRELEVSLAFTNTLGNRLFFVGLKPDGSLSLEETKFDRCMGLKALGNQTLYLVTRYQIWRLENALPLGRVTEDGCDRLYLPTSAYTTGVVNVHDVDVDRDGTVLFVNTRFACLSRVSEKDNFEPLWKPSFIQDLIPGDPCHLNGLAMRDGLPAYVTCFSRTSESEGWREQKLAGGTILEVPSNEVVVSGLCMPHSPHFYRDSLWITNSGSGHFGRVDLQQGRFEPMVFAPGFLRGLDFIGDFAVIGSSKPRYSDFFAGLPLEENIRKHNACLHRGLYIVDLRLGEIVHWFGIEGLQGEIYDVIVLPGVRRARAVSLEGEDIQRLITIGPYGRLFSEG
jgi:uncharacterized protein (TIGR03032 family)